MRRFESWFFWLVAFITMNLIFFTVTFPNTNPGWFVLAWMLDVVLWIAVVGLLLREAGVGRVR